MKQPIMCAPDARFSVKCRTALRNLSRSPALRVELAIAAALLIALCCALAAGIQEQRAIADKMLRLHVVAQSDSAEDQALKLAVRDRLLDDFFSDLAVFDTAAEAEDYLRGCLPQIETLAADTLAARGSALPVSVSIAEEVFPARSYAQFSLPAGTYTALRVVLGDGDGANWWCVMFPPLCTAAAAEPAYQTEVYFTDGEWRTVTSQAPDVKIKFKLLDWAASVKRLFTP